MHAEMVNIDSSFIHYLVKMEYQVCRQFHQNVQGYHKAESLPVGLNPQKTNEKIGLKYESLDVVVIEGGVHYTWASFHFLVKLGFLFHSIVTNLKQARHLDSCPS